MKKRVLSVLLVLILTFSLGPLTALAAPSYDPYTALGDSITAGYTLEGKLRGSARNSVTPYVDIAANALGISTFHNDSVLGMDSGDLLKLLNCTGDTNPPSYFGLSEEDEYYDIKTDLADPNLITIAIGSNDLTMTLADMVYECIIPGVDTSAFTPMDHICALEIIFTEFSQLEDYFNTMSASSESMPTLPANLETLLEALCDKDPASRLQQAVNEFKANWDQIIAKLSDTGATIAAIGYYNPYPMLETTIPLPSGKELNLGFQCYIDQMNAYISGASGECSATNEYIYIDVSDGGQPGSAITLCSYGDPHPNAAGHEEIARRLVAALQPAFAPVYVAPTYSIKSEAAEGGSITPSGVTHVTHGGSATFDITPDDGYVIASILVDGNAADITDSYTFKNINGSHTISVTFVKNPYADVDEDDWFYKAVMGMYVMNLMTGVSETEFDPNMSTSRAMIAAIIYRMEGNPEVSYSDVFSDVPAGEWYTNAVLWASENGIVTGYGDKTFRPEDSITREQLILVLYNYAKYKGYDMSKSASLSGFADASQISNWAKTAMEWGVAQGLLFGNSLNELYPGGSAVRATCAALIYRFLTKL